MTPGTLVVGLFLLVIVAFVIWKMIRDKKAGKSSCGCGCDCSSCGHCASTPSASPKSK